VAAMAAQERLCLEAARRRRKHHAGCQERQRQSPGLHLCSRCHCGDLCGRLARQRIARALAGMAFRQEAHHRKHAHFAGAGFRPPVLNNPSFRANMLVPEGATGANGLISVGEGVLVQPLPSSLRLKDFVVDYYSTGMPSSFRSVVEVIDPDTGERFERNIEVNEPLRYKGVTVYQSSFDDGGSTLKLKGYPLEGAANQPFEVSGVVGSRSEIS